MTTALALVPPILTATTVQEAAAKAQEILVASNALVIRTEADEANAGHRLTVIREALKQATKAQKEYLAPHEAEIAGIKSAFAAIFDAIKQADVVITSKMTEAYIARKRAQEAEARRVEEERRAVEREQQRLRDEAAARERERVAAEERARQATEEAARAAQETASGVIIVSNGMEPDSLEEFFRTFDAPPPEPVNAVEQAQEAREAAQAAAQDAADAQTRALIAGEALESLLPPPGPAHKTTVAASGATATARESFDYKVTDLAKVPEHYTIRMIDNAAVRAAIKAAGKDAGKLQIPGIEIFEKVGIATGRRKT